MTEFLNVPKESIIKFLTCFKAPSNLSLLFHQPQQSGVLMGGERVTSTSTCTAEISLFALSLSQHSRLCDSLHQRLWVRGKAAKFYLTLGLCLTVKNLISGDRSNTSKEGISSKIMSVHQKKPISVDV
ncbi:uncharacterized [Tachysurus ichikawai]